MIRSLFPTEVITVSGSDGQDESALLPEEAACLARAVPKRRREFTAGRAYAREALGRLGISGFPLLAGPDRAPIWPAGVAGTVSHCSGFCGVAVVRRGSVQSVGLDAEPATCLPAELVRRVCVPSEILWAGAASALAAGDWFKLIFSAKESLYKCWYPLAGRWLGFLDVRLTIDAQAASFTVAFLGGQQEMLPAGCVLAGRFKLEGDHILTSVTLATAPGRRPQ